MLHWHSTSHIVYGMREKDSEEEVSNKQSGLMEVWRSNSAWRWDRRSSLWSGLRRGGQGLSRCLNWSHTCLIKNWAWVYVTLTDSVSCPHKSALLQVVITYSRWMTRQRSWPEGIYNSCFTSTYCTVIHAVTGNHKYSKALDQFCSINACKFALLS